jgi:hypothetical protein
MRRVSAVLFVIPVLVGSEVLNPAGIGAAGGAPSPRAAVVMEVRTSFDGSASRCDLYTFVAAPPQPEVGATLCAIGGPFGDGAVGTVLPSARKFAGTTIHLDRTVTFNDTDALYISTVFNFTEQVRAGTGGLNYFSGTWEITGGTGAFASLRGQGSLVNAIVSNVNVPPPPQYAREELVGWVSP